MALDHGILVRIQARQHFGKLRAFRNDIPLSFWSEAIESDRSAVILERSVAKQSQLAFYFSLLIELIVITVSLVYSFD